MSATARTTRYQAARVGDAGLDLFANALEVFKADAATGALHLQHDRLLDAVVFVPLVGSRRQPIASAQSV